MLISPYYDRPAIEAKVLAGQHRAVIGGLWEHLGQLQRDFLIGQGLKPDHVLLDIGCGSLRGGVKLIDYLNAGHYFGTDLNEALLNVGYDIELARAGLTAKLPRSHLVANGDFDFGWCPRPVDVALAQSVFTHLPLGYLRSCLERLWPVMKLGGQFYLTIYQVPDAHPVDEPFRHEPGGIVSHDLTDPYHHRVADVAQCARDLPWTPRAIGGWDHPRGQQMIVFTRAD